MTQTVLESARAAREQAYAPYSSFRVGAAVLTEGGRVFSGCNVENISLGLTICAERSAIFSAVAAGERRFRELVIVADSEEPIAPCGACRQVMAEFSEDLEIHAVNLLGLVHTARLSTLLPRPKAGILEGRGANVPRGTPASSE